MDVGTLFTGIGGWDLAWEQAGARIAWQCETNAAARSVLRRHWPEVPCYGDIRTIHATLPPVDVVAGSDPCPIRSRARSNGASRHPDLAGYFLAVVGRLRPRWVVRENVPAPDVRDFCACLDLLGYGSVVVRLDAAGVTGQSRPRDFVVGGYQVARHAVRECFADAPDGAGPLTTRLGTGPVAPALTTHRTRYDSRDCYVWDPADGLRILDGDEREALAGFPAGWTAGLSEAARARCYGNAVVPGCAAYIAGAIMSYETACGVTA